MGIGRWFCVVLQYSRINGAQPLASAGDGVTREPQEAAPLRARLSCHQVGPSTLDADAVLIKDEEQFDSVVVGRGRVDSIQARR